VNPDRLCVGITVQERKIKKGFEGAIEVQFSGNKGLEGGAEVGSANGEYFEWNSIGMQKGTQEEDLDEGGVALDDFGEANGQRGGDGAGMASGELSPLLE
jgi:hypothetical protein